MIKLAKHELLLVLPTINAFYRQERIGTIELLKQAAERDHRVNVRILTPTNDAIEKNCKPLYREMSKEIVVEEDQNNNN
jgi:hypothetical protein